jgi:hypothetical protein
VIRRRSKASLVVHVQDLRIGGKNTDHLEVQYSGGIAAALGLCEFAKQRVMRSYSINSGETLI